MTRIQARYVYFRRNGQLKYHSVALFALIVCLFLCLARRDLHGSMTVCRVYLTHWAPWPGWQTPWFLLNKKQSSCFRNEGVLPCVTIYLSSLLFSLSPNLSAATRYTLSIFVGFVLYLLRTFFFFFFIALILLQSQQRARKVHWSAFDTAAYFKRRWGQKMVVEYGHCGMIVYKLWLRHCHLHCVIRG